MTLRKCAHAALPLIIPPKTVMHSITVDEAVPTSLDRSSTIMKDLNRLDTNPSTTTAKIDKIVTDPVSDRALIHDFLVLAPAPTMIITPAIIITIILSLLAHLPTPI